MARRFWHFLKLWAAELDGRAAYARYVEHVRRDHPDAAILSRADWFKREQERQWQTIRRCC